MGARWRGVAAGCVLLATASAACTPDAGDRSEPTPDPGPATRSASELPVGGWRRDQLPSHRGWRPAPRAIVACGDDLLVLGAEARRDGTTRPAAWLGHPRAWQRLAFSGGDLYARQALLSSAACRGDRIVTVGAKSGGAHFLPRTSTWVGSAAGGLVNVPARFEVFGGPRAISVGTLAAGPPGFLLAGTRLSGAVVWRSADGAAFSVEDGAPGLTSEGDSRTVGQAAARVGDDWVVVGTVGMPGDPGSPAAWSSADGRVWTAEPVGSGEGYGTLELAVGGDDEATGAGLDGQTFRLWQRREGRWTEGPRFAQLATSPSQAAYVTGLCPAGEGTVASVADGRGYQLWLVGDDLARVPTPERVTGLPSDGDTTMTACAWRHSLVVATDDGVSGALWTRPLP